MSQEHWKNRLEKIEGLARKVRGDSEIPDYNIEAHYWLEEHDRYLQQERKAHGKEERHRLDERMIVAYKMLCWSIGIKLCCKSDCTERIEEGRRKFCCEEHRDQQRSWRYRQRKLRDDPESLKKIQAKHYRKYYPDEEGQ